VGHEPDSKKLDPAAQTRPLLPQPSPLFWRQAWIKFQRALDPLALPKRPPVRTQLKILQSNPDPKDADEAWKRSQERRSPGE
jgi:hypothetical protein